MAFGCRSNASLLMYRAALLAWALCVLNVAASQCDLACQDAQLAAVQTVLSALGAPQQSALAAPGPQHCSWRGVSCCTSNYTLEVSRGLPDERAMACSQPNSVAALVLPMRNLSGVLPAGGWAALQTLQYLDLTGALLGCLPAIRQMPALGLQRAGRSFHFHECISTSRPLQHCSLIGTHEVPSADKTLLTCSWFSF